MNNNLLVRNSSTMKWWQVIVVSLYLTSKKQATNTEILNSSIVQEKIKNKRLKRITGIISKTLNTHAVYGVSKDKQHCEPVVFYKNDDAWALTEIGLNFAKELLGE